MSPISYRLARIVSGAFLACIYRVEVRHHDHVPAEGAFILAPIHRSYLDPILSARVTTRPLHFMAKRSLFAIKPIGAYLRSLGAVPINRGSADVRAYRQFVTILRAGEALVVFPEGTRSQKDSLSVGMVNEGATTLGRRMDVPVFPLAIYGSASAFQGKTWFLRRRRIVLILGKRLEGADVTPEILHASLQRLLDEAATR